MSKELLCIKHGAKIVSISILTKLFTKKIKKK